MEQRLRDDSSSGEEDHHPSWCYTTMKLLDQLGLQECWELQRLMTGPGGTSGAKRGRSNKPMTEWQRNISQLIHNQQEANYRQVLIAHERLRHFSLYRTTLLTNPTLLIPCLNSMQARGQRVISQIRAAACCFRKERWTLPDGTTSIQCGFCQQHIGGVEADYDPELHVLVLCEADEVRRERQQLLKEVKLHGPDLSHLSPVNIFKWMVGEGRVSEGRNPQEVHQLMRGYATKLASMHRQQLKTHSHPQHELQPTDEVEMDGLEEDLLEMDELAQDHEHPQQ